MPVLIKFPITVVVLRLHGPTHLLLQFTLPTFYHLHRIHHKNTAEKIDQLKRLSHFQTISYDHESKQWDTLWCGRDSSCFRQTRDRPFAACLHLLLPFQTTPLWAVFDQRWYHQVENEIFVDAAAHSSSSRSLALYHCSINILLSNHFLQRSSNTFSWFNLREEI